MLTRWVVSLLGVLLFALPPQAGADTVLFGPEVFTRGVGRPATEQREFETYGYEYPFTLHVQSGTKDGDRRCSSATVWLDGRRVLRPADFSQEEGEKRVTVSASERAALHMGKARYMMPWPSS